jgi:hypothetical protein
MNYNSSSNLILTKDAIVNGTNLPTHVFESKGMVGGSKRKYKSRSKYQKKGGKSRKSRKNRRRSFRRK